MTVMININLSKKQKIIIVAVAVALLGLVGYTIWAIQNSYRQVEESAKAGKKVQQFKKDQKQSLIDEVNKRYAAKDYKGAIELIEGQQNANDVEMQLLLASAYFNSSDFKKALDVYKRLDSRGKLPDTSLENMAKTAERANEYRLAIDMYKRAKEYGTSSGDVNTDQLATYDYKIAELEKKL